MKNIKNIMLLSFLLISLMSVTVVNAQSWNYQVNFDEPDFPAATTTLQNGPGGPTQYCYDFLINNGAGPGGSSIYAAGQDGTDDMCVDITVVRTCAGWQQADGDYDTTSSGSFRSDFTAGTANSSDPTVCSQENCCGYVKFDFTFINGLQNSVTADLFATRHTSANGSSEGYEWTEIFLNGTFAPYEANMCNYTNADYSDLTGCTDFSGTVYDATTLLPNNITMSEFLASAAAGTYAPGGQVMPGWWAVDDFNTSVYCGVESSTGGANPAAGNGGPDDNQTIGGSLASGTAGGNDGDFGLADSDLVSRVTYFFGLTDVSFDTDGDGCTEMNSLPSAGVTFFDLGFSSPVCDADPGTVTITSPTFLCALGQGVSKLTVTTNNDFETTPADPCGLAGTPGVGYLVYSATPNGGDPCTDPNFTGASLGSGPAMDPGCLNQNVAYSYGTPTCAGPIGWGEVGGVANQNINTTFQVCPIYLFDEATGLVSVDYDCTAATDLCGPVVGTDCAEFVVLGPVEFSNNMLVCGGDPYLGTLTVDIAGGYPAYVAATGLDPLANALFSVSETTGNGTLTATTIANGGTITLSNIADGPYSIDVTDANGCVHTFAGVWNQPTISLMASASKVCQFDTDCSTANVVDLTGMITPLLGSFQICGTGDGFPSETSWQITNSTGAVVAGAGPGSSIPGATGGLDPNETYEITFFDTFGDGFSCLPVPSFTVVDDGGNGCAGTVVYTYGAGDWEGTSCGDTDNANFPNGDGSTFGPFLLGSPTAYIDPIGVLSGTGVTDNLDNTGTFDANMAAGTYTINYDYTDSQGCVLHEEVMITICANPAAPVPVEAAVLVCTTDDLTDALGVTPVTGVVFNWFGPSATSPTDVTTGSVAMGANYTPALPATVGTAETYWVVPSSTDPVSGLTCYGCPVSITITSEVCCMLDVTCPTGPITLECIDDLPAGPVDSLGFVALGGVVNESCNSITVTFVDADDLAMGCAASPRTVMRTITISDPGTGESEMCTINYVFADVTPPMISCPGGGVIDCSTAPDPIVYIASSFEGVGTDCTDGPDGEYVQICATNACTGCPSTGVDISGWVIDDNVTDGTTNHTIVITSGTLMPGECLTIYSGSLTATPTVSPMVTGSLGSMFVISSVRQLCTVWNNSGDGIFLYNGSLGTLIDSESWTANGVVTYAVPALTGCPVPTAGGANLTCADPLPPVDLTAPMVSDNCTMVGNIVVTHEGDDADPTTFSFCAADGPFVVNRTYRATDECGNFSECIETFTWDADTEAPMITCPSAVTGLDCNSTLPAAATDIAGFLALTGAVATDNCTAQGSLTVSSMDDIDPSTFSFCAVDGPFVVTRTYTIADGCMNASTCTQTFTWEADTEAPMITCPSAVTGLNCNSTLPAAATDIAGFLALTGAVATDNCTAQGSLTVSSMDDIDPSTFSFCAVDGPFVVTRTYTITDGCLNASMCTQTFTWDADVIPPVVTCPANINNLECQTAVPGATDFTSFLAAGGTAVDNCSAIDQLVFSFADSGSPASLDYCSPNPADRTITRTYSIADACGNIGTCAQTFEYNQSLNGPVITAMPSNQIIECSSNAMPQLYLFEAEAECGLEITYSVGDVVVSGTPNCPGTTYSYTYTATDGCDRSVFHTQVYTIQNDGPELICPSNPICQIECTTSNDEILEAFNWYAGAATVVTSCTGLETTISNTFNPNGFIEVNCNSNQFAIPNVKAWQNVTFTATDPCGRMSSCTRLVVIVDNEGPIIEGEPQLAIRECDDRSQLEYDTWLAEQIANMNATDACGDVNWNTTPASPNEGPWANGYAITHTIFTATDDCGNSTTREAHFKLRNNHPPSWTSTLDDQTVECDGTLPSFDTPTWSNGCGVTILTFEDVTTPGACAGEYSITRTWTVTDNCEGVNMIAQTIFVEDNTAPVAPAAPADVAIECRDDVPAPIDLTAVDNCAGDITVSPIAVVTPGSCDNQFMMVRTWTFDDGCGNVSSVSQTINVNDTTPPDAPTAPADVDVQCASDVSAPVDLTAMDNCDGDITVSPSAVITPGDCDNQYTMVRTWTFIDKCGNESSVSQTINVNDTTAPDAPAAPADVDVQCASDVPAPVDLTAMDNCDGDITVSPSAVITPGDCDNQYTMVRTWTFIDMCGNESSVSQTINVNDTTAPDAPAPPMDVNVECASDVPAPVDLTAMDNCDGDITVSPSAVITPGDCDNQYTMVRIWTFIDMCGNESSVSQTINVNDTTAPDAPAPPMNVNVECASDVPAPVDLTAMDNCDGDITVSPSAVITPGDCDNQYTMVRTWTFIDMCGNQSSVSQTINVNDTTAPDAPAPPMDVNVECASDVPAPVDLTAMDNCDGDITVSPSAVITPGDCDNQYTMVRTWTFIDMCGNQSSVSQTINVNDTTAPDAPAPPMDVNVQCDGDLPAPVDLTAMDNCDGEITVSPSAVVTPGDCDNQYTMVRTWTFIDGCGNQSNVSQTIIVNDDMAPVIDAPADMMQQCGSVPMFGDATATDNCVGQITLTFEDTDDGQGCAGSATRTWTATDECGNVSTAAQTITFLDDEPPHFTHVPEDVDVVCGPIDFEEPTAMDNCGSVTLTYEDEQTPGELCDYGYRIYRTWTATDDCENTATVVTSMWVGPDDSRPHFDYFPDDIVITCDEFPPTPEEPTVSDNCGVISLTYETEYGTGGPNSCDNDEGFDWHVIWTATDACGNTRSKKQNVWVDPSHGADLATISGHVYTESNDMIEDVMVHAEGSANGWSNNEMTESEGYFEFGLPMNNNYAVTPERNDDPMNGVSTMDLILISQHVLGVNMLESPYKLIAADVNNSGNITSFDMIELRNLILLIDAEFQNNTSWRFVDASYVFINPTNPFATTFPEVYNINDLANVEIADFVGIKTGDVSGDVIANGLQQRSDTRDGLNDLVFQVDDQQMTAGETYTVEFKARDFKEVLGYQFTLNFDQRQLEFIDVEMGELENLTTDNFGFRLLNEGVLTSSWNVQEGLSVADDATLFSLTFKAKSTIDLSQTLSISSRFTVAEAYSQSDALMNVALDFDTRNGVGATLPFALYQNQPNPFKDQTVISFSLPESTTATLTIYDVTGRMVQQVKGDYTQGYNEVSISRADLGQKGLLYYRLETSSNNATRKMLVH